MEPFISSLLYTSPDKSISRGKCFNPVLADRGQVDSDEGSHGKLEVKLE